MKCRPSQRRSALNYGDVRCDASVPENSVNNGFIPVMEWNQDKEMK